MKPLKSGNWRDASFKAGAERACTFIQNYIKKLIDKTCEEAVLAGDRRDWDETTRTEARLETLRHLSAIIKEWLR